MGFWDIFYAYGYIIAILMMVVSLIISANCKRSFNKYAKVMARNGLTGAAAAQRILSAYGVNDVTIQPIQGDLTDNYNPSDKTLNLSESVYANSSIAAIGVAAHECGHAIQHNVGFVPNKIRSALVPVLFYLVTLPVELDASRRALKILKNDGLLAGDELSGARAVLSAAAMTYIAAAASAIVTLLRLISYGKRRN